jgi:hypothetical protein
VPPASVCLTATWKELVDRALQKKRPSGRMAERLIRVPFIRAFLFTLLMAFVVE